MPDLATTMTRRLRRTSLVLFAVAMLSLTACQAATSSPTTSELPSLSPGPSASESAEATATAEPTDLSLVTIGDSIPYAREDCGGCASFTTLFPDSIEADTGMTVDPQNLSSHDGLTGARLVDRIRTSEPMRTALAGADIIVVTIGHNDTPWNVADDTCDGAAAGPEADWSSYTGQCVIQLAARHGEELDAILSEIETLRGDKPNCAPGHDRLQRRDRVGPGPSRVDGPVG
jgi:hypothetical protein